MDHSLYRSGHVNDPACEHCAAFFIARRSDQRFCSDRCRLRQWRLMKATLSASAPEGHSAAAPTRTVREVLFGLLDENSPNAVVERVQTAVAELTDLEREAVRLRRQNAVLRARVLGADPAGAPLHDRSDGC